MFQPILKKVGGHNPVYRGVEVSEWVALNEVLALFNEAIGKFKTNDQPHELAYAYLNRGVVHSFLNHLNDAYDDCVQAENLGLDVPLLFRNKGVALVMLDRAGEAVGEFKKAVDRGDETSFLYYLRALIQSNQLGQARKILLEKIPYPKISMIAGNLELYLIYSEILERELDTEGADRIVDVAKAKFPHDGEVFIRLANSTRTRHGTKKAIEVVLDALPSVTRKNDILELMLADLYFVSNMWQEALDAYSKFARSDYYDLPISRTLICLFNLGKHASCLEKLKPLKAKHPSEKLLRDLEARIYFGAEEFATASALYRDLAISFKDPDYYLGWGHCEFRLAHHDEAKRILNSASKEFYDKPDDSMRISGAFALIGETKKAVELAFRATSIAPQSADAALNYFFVFNQHSVLHHEEGDFTGEQVQMANDIGEHFEERFPGVPGLKKFRLPKPDEQMTAAEFTRIFKEEMPSEVDSRKREQIYLTYRYPLSTFSILVGKDIVDTWERVTANSSYNLWAYNPQNFPEEDANIGSKVIVAEPIAILTLHKLKCLNLLEKLFEKVAVPQRFLDTVQRRIASERLSEFEGSTEIFINGDSLGLIKTSPEIIAKRIEESKELRDFLTDRVTGFPIVDDFSFREEIKPYLRGETIQAAERAVVMNVPLLCDEAYLAFVPNMPRLRTISTYIILNQSLRKGLLGMNEFNKAILDLASAGYHFIPINAQILIQGLRESDFKVTRRSTAGFQSIAHIDSEPILDAIVIAEFLGLLFNVRVTELTKGYWFDYAMDCIPKIRFDLATLLKKMETHLEEVTFGGVSNDVVIKWVKVRIRYWLKKRGISLPK
jgi:tetratricopeptide (TPR) repeat protein